MDVARVPITTASRKGVSALAAAGEQQRTILTSHGRPVAVVDTAARLDTDVRRMREASLAVLDAAADLAWGRARKFNLDETCARIGLDPELVRTRARQSASTVQSR